MMTKLTVPVHSTTCCERWAMRRIQGREARRPRLCRRKHERERPRQGCAHARPGPAALHVHHAPMRVDAQLDQSRRRRSSQSRPAAPAHPREGGWWSSCHTPHICLDQRAGSMGSGGAQSRYRSTSRCTRTPAGQGRALNPVRPQFGVANRVAVLPAHLQHRRVHRREAGAAHVSCEIILIVGPCRWRFHGEEDNEEDAQLLAEAQVENQSKGHAVRRELMLWRRHLEPFKGLVMSCRAETVLDHHALASLLFCSLHIRY